jgi:hypothetical protein
MAIITISKYLIAGLAAVRAVSGQGAVPSYTPPVAPPSYTSSSVPIAPVPTIPVPGLSTPVTQVLVPATPATTSPTGTVETTVIYSCLPTTVQPVAPFVTVYNTVYINVCPTGTTSVTYTITDTCGCQHSSDYTRPTGVPSGFTVTSLVCTACPGQPTLAITQPIAGGNANVNAVPATGAKTAANAGSTTAPKPAYATTNDGMRAGGSSMLGSVMVMSMALVAGLMFVL